MINKNEFVILDGAMGTMLQKAGLPLGERPELLSISNPKTITNIHKQYIEAGADIIYANTFGANEIKLEGTNKEVEEVVFASIAAAKEATAGTSVLVALDMGPLGELLEPNGTLSFERAYDCFKRMTIAGEKAGADLVAIETMTDLYEVKAAILAIKENSSLPIICSMSFEKNGRTFTGCSLEAMATLLEGLGIEALGINCSLGPDEIYPLAKELCSYTNMPVFVKPNAGLPDPLTGNYGINADDFAKSLERYAEIGVCMVGGCCGTTPEYIAKLKQIFKTKKVNKSIHPIESRVSSSTKVVNINDVTIIGERINPTGKKLMRQALLDGDMGYILRQAVSQAEAGANVLDVNVGAPGVDEVEMLPRVIKQIQSVVDLPLQLDCSDAKALEAGLRVYNGKPIVNSVNGDKEVLDTILPLVKKYGASVVGLTLDKNGIPTNAQQRIDIAKRIVESANSYGIDNRDVYIDCLTLTVSAQQEDANHTLAALSRVKNELNLKTVLGVSNISFGLPNRELLNHSFLLMALHSGLDLPIMNPNNASMMDAVRAYRVLSNKDKQSLDFIEAYKDMPKQTPLVQSTVVVKKSEDQEYHPLIKAVKDGLDDEVKALTLELLKTTSPMDVVNNYLIPALDVVGDLFEKGTFFLPQLLKSATSAQKAFEEIKKILKNSDVKVTKGPIIMATVQGDIHDIGKNIVKVILENYGYKVIDLGRDVPPELIVEQALKTKAPLIGLSALMTTTLKSMEKTIKALKDANCPSKVFVGGAVLTEDYAMQIGADYYSKDAKQAVDVAKKVIK